MNYKRSLIPRPRNKKSKSPRGRKVAIFTVTLATVSFATVAVGQHNNGGGGRDSGGRDSGGNSSVRDPGVRGATVDSGKPLGSVATDPNYMGYFTDGLNRFQEIENVTQGQHTGLGPRFNSNQCASCHSQPAPGGSSPSATVFPGVGMNPEFLVANFNSAQNSIPPFVTADGPTREARFKFFLNSDGSLSNNPDGGVHDLYTVTGSADANGCTLKQPDFAHNLALNNVIFRVPTPVFGAGMMENITDATILNNMSANSQAKNALNITGHPNRNGNDGTISRFGWKAQNKSLEVFSGEAYNVEMGVTNELFQNERASPDETELPPSCLLNPTPEDATNTSSTTETGVVSDVVGFSMFMRLLAPPTPSTSEPGGSASIARGSQAFNAIGCALCHTPMLKTGTSAFTSDLNNANANLFSDLIVHHMGTNLADGVSQGTAGPDEFRSAPLWGLGQRIFFLHDGRTSDLLDAIQEHASQGSEANGVIRNFNHQLSPQQQQDVLNFLRSL